MKVTQESTLRAVVRRRFDRLTYPLLGVVLREVDQMLMDRVAGDPAKAYGEQVEYDRQREREIIRLNPQ